MFMSKYVEETLNSALIFKFFYKNLKDQQVI